MEYIDTMKILLGTYSVSWLAFRLAEIVREMLLNRIAMIKRKVAQYNRRVFARRTLMSSIFYKNDTFKQYDKNYKNLKSYVTVKKILKNSKFSKNSLRKNFFFKIKN